MGKVWVRTSAVALAAVAAAAASSGDASSRAVAKNEFHDAAYALRRALAPSIQLCGNSEQTEVPLIASKCDLAASAAITGMWESCCSFGSQASNSTCRTFETQGQYCNECDMNPEGFCQGLSKDDEMTLYVKFTPKPENEQCCKTCTCFGDPECVSFAGVLNLWIPCDARTVNSCMPTKNACLDTVSPNGYSCQWTRTDRNDASGWNMAMKGSPCRPTNLDVKPVTMNMYKSTGFDITLNLGERGIIEDAYFTIQGKNYNLNAQSCFDDATVGPMYGWSGAGVPAGAKSFIDSKGQEVSWLFLDEKSSTFVRLACSRAVEKGVGGPPRININEVTVESDAASSGFCSTGKIAEDNTGGGGLAIHTDCTLETPDALNACKNLVSQAFTQRDLEVCSIEYCSNSAWGDLDISRCLDTLGKGSNDGAWLTAYCNSINIRNPSVSVKNCKDKVKGQGYLQQVEEWGKGYKIKDANRDGCGSQLGEYVIANKPPCEDGVYVDLLKNGSWVPTYFIPVTKPLCGDAITINGGVTSDNQMFASSVRLRQCDIKEDPVCQNTSPCASSAKIEFALKYDSVPRKIMAAYKNNVLTCAKNSQGSTTWCLPDSFDYKPVDEVCECPPDNGRLLLTTGKSH